MKREYTCTTLKYLAMLTMLIDHIGVCLIERTMLYQVEIWKSVYMICRLVGRIAFPLYCFLMVEAFLHTKNRKRYLLTLIGLAILTEPIFDLALYGKWNWSHQNVLVSLAIGFVMLWILEKVEVYSRNITDYPVKIGYLICGNLLPIVLAGLLAWRLQTDYSYVGIVLIAMIYLLRNQRALQALWCFFILSAEGGISVIFASYLIYCYNGKLGTGKIPRWFYRLFYPIHLLILFLIRNLILGV